MFTEGNMKEGVSKHVKVPGLVISGYGNAANTTNYHALCNKKGNTLRQKDGKTLIAYNYSH